MKIVDYAILFFAIFLCVFLSGEMDFSKERALVMSEVIMNKNMDRSNEDALLDVVKTEDDEGLPVADEGQIESAFKEGVESDFDITDDYNKNKATEGFSYNEYGIYEPVTDSIKGPQYLTEYADAWGRRKIPSGSRIVKK
ncbi:MAG: hypothetical protein K6E56_03040 [Lachnospiraceae bacterium]|nr:hypothetical protein [Lachnospiraceae bacterium]